MRKLVRHLCRVTILLILTSCHSQESKGKQGIDEQLTLHYDAVVDSYHEGEYDAITLQKFRDEIVNIFQNHQVKDLALDSLSNRIKIVSSGDKNLTIASWNTSPGMNRRNYNSIFQVVQDGKIYAGDLVNTAENEVLKSSETNALYFEVHPLKDSKYAILGYGTYGGGHEFYTMRVLQFNKGVFKDCSGCFDGKDILVFRKTRGTEDSILFDAAKQLVTYPEYNMDAATSFMTATGRIIKLQYNKEGKFIKIQ